ncbi:MAG TPA: hypothetical protein VMS65_06715, partial [Polyangiaceae bacterium]|nr:hypothetical protein [Polyangiaceae bacterium]
VTSLGSGDVNSAERFEGRRFAKKPTLALTQRALERFPSSFEAYFNDRLPLRHSLVELNAWIRFRIFGISPNPAIMVGQRGWFYDGYGRERVQGSEVRDRDNVSDHTGRLAYTDAELRRWARVLEERRSYLDELGIKYVFALAPGKRMVYPEYLPAPLQPLRRESRQEQLSRYLKAHSKVAVIDLTEPLLAARKRSEDPPVFYKTDEHWNFYGAFVAYRAMIERANGAFSGLAGPPLELASFDLQTDADWSHPRFHATLGTEVKEPYFRLVARPGNALARLHFSMSPVVKQVDARPAGKSDVLSLDKEGVGGTGEIPDVAVHGADGEGAKVSYVKSPEGRPLDRIVLFGDSFIEKCFYYFAANAREVYWYREVLGFPTTVIDAVKPEIVFEEIVQRYLLIELPENPKHVTHAYLAAAFRKASKDLFETKLAASEEPSARRQRGKRRSEDRVATFQLPPLEPQGTGPIVVAIEVGKTVQVRLTTGSGRREAVITTLNIEPRAPAYVELDARQARRGVRVLVDAAKRARITSIRVRQGDG